jgi:hypothetical protein
MKERGYATECKCGNSKCKMIFNNDVDFCRLMNNLRLVILFFADKLADSVECDFNVFTEYAKIEECGATEKRLRVCMEKVYAHYDRLLR